MPPPDWQNPVTVSVGQTQSGIDPLSLMPSGFDLQRARLAFQCMLLLSGILRHSPIMITPDGVVYDGHHVVRAAAELGKLVEAIVVGFSISPSADSIMDLPVV